jgi:hypothetical protein
MSRACSQGLNTTAPREITGLIPVDEVVNLMRALGYYPTQQVRSLIASVCRSVLGIIFLLLSACCVQQVEDIRTEIRFRHLHQSSKIKDLVDLEEFLRCMWSFPCVALLAWC